VEISGAFLDARMVKGGGASGYRLLAWASWKSGWIRRSMYSEETLYKPTLYVARR
jgi:hypothetical protein